jgi:hypothetical protein
VGEKIILTVQGHYFESWHLFLIYENQNTTTMLTQHTIEWIWCVEGNHNSQPLASKRFVFCSFVFLALQSIVVVFSQSGS